MRPPRIGDLTSRAVISRRADVPFGEYGVTETYVEVARRWARREPVGGAIYVGSLQTGGAITHRIFMRRLDRVGLDHVIDVDGFRHAVKRSTDLGGAGRWTVLEVQELGPLS